MFLAKEIRTTALGGKCIILQDSPISFHVSISHGNCTIGENILSPNSLEELNAKIDELEMELLGKNMGEVSMKVNTQTLSLDEALTKVNTGWHSLVNEAYEVINSVEQPPVVLLVKEKFGGLRVYTAPYLEEIEDKLIQIQKKSFTVCEVCGNEGSLRSKERYITLCDKHAEGAESIEPFDNGFLW